MAGYANLEAYLDGDEDTKVSLPKLLKELPNTEEQRGRSVPSRLVEYLRNQKWETSQHILLIRNRFEQEKLRMAGFTDLEAYLDGLEEQNPLRVVKEFLDL